MVKKILKMIVFIMVLSLLLSFAGAISAQPDTYELTSQDKVILTKPAVCFITTYFWGYVLDPWEDTWSDAYYRTFVGTGFCVNPDTGHIVTAGHMVEINAADFKYDLIRIYLEDTYGTDLDDWTDDDWSWAHENTKVEGSDGGDYDMEVFVQFDAANVGIPDNPPGDMDTSIRAELIDYSGWEQRDIAILKIQPQTGGALSSVLIGDSSSVEIQDSLTIIGYPSTGTWGSRPPSITDGNLSGKIMLAGTEVMLIQESAREGISGSPVLNQDGEVIGILTRGTDYTNTYLRPSNDVKEMLDSNGVINTLGMVDEEFKQGLVNYRLEHFSKAIEHFNTVLNLNQRHLQAKIYKTSSQETIKKEEVITTDGETPSGTTDTPAAEEDRRIFTPGRLFIVVLIVFIILAVIIRAVVRRKRR